MLAEQELRHRQRKGELPNMRRSDDQLGVGHSAAAQPLSEEIDDPAVADDRM